MAGLPSSKSFPPLLPFLPPYQATLLSPLPTSQQTTSLPVENSSPKIRQIIPFSQFSRLILKVFFQYYLIFLLSGFSSIFWYPNHPGIPRGSPATLSWSLFPLARLPLRRCAFVSVARAIQPLRANFEGIGCTSERSISSKTLKIDLQPCQYSPPPPLRPQVYLRHRGTLTRTSTHQSASNFEANPLV